MWPADVLMPEVEGGPVRQTEGSRTRVRCERWRVRERRVKVTHRHVLLPVCPVLKEGVNWKQQLGRPSALGDTETESLSVPGAGRCRGGVTGAEVAWKRDVRARWADCSPSLADSSWLGGSSVVCSTCAGGTCDQAHVSQGKTGETRGQRESLVSKPQLPFDLWSQDVTSAKVRERQEVKTIAGKLDIHASAFPLSAAHLFANVN